MGIAAYAIGWRADGRFVQVATYNTRCIGKLLIIIAL
jgi:hypothetical protein